jgi:hypothetical protein
LEDAVAVAVAVVDAIEEGTRLMGSDISGDEGRAVDEDDDDDAAVDDDDDDDDAGAVEAIAFTKRSSTFASG